LITILVVMLELGTLAFLRMRFFKTSFATSLLNVALAVERPTYSVTLSWSSSVPSML
jgi:hypothetical protein